MSNNPETSSIWGTIGVVAIVVGLFGTLALIITWAEAKREQDEADYAACLTWRDEYRHCPEGSTPEAKSCRQELRQVRPDKCAPERKDQE